MNSRTGIIEIDLNPEFGYELVCSAPYAYWLKEQGKYVKVVTSKGMKPFYWFCDEIIEKYETRSLDNSTNGVQNLPNTWIHHNSLAVLGKEYSTLSEKEKEFINGVLDYSQWTPPPYRDRYLDLTLNLPNNSILISNRYNLEHNLEPVGYFDLESLYYIFNTLTEKGYNVIYKRPSNTEFVTDPNERIGKDIEGILEDGTKINDFDLASYLKGVYLFDDILKQIPGTYNEAQLKLFSSMEGFISMGGGSSILCSYFKKPVIIYVNVSKDVRPGYFDGDSYFTKLSNASIYPVVDKKEDILKRGYRDYSKVYNYISKIF